MNAATLYRVTRFCCRSGLCIHCRGSKQRKRIVQADNLSLEKAKRYVEGWSEHEPKMEPQPDKAAP